MSTVSSPPPAAGPEPSLPAWRLAGWGLPGLAALTATHWLRAHLAAPGAAVASVLGVMPNLCAGYAMPLVGASLLAETGEPARGVTRGRFLRLLAVTTAGLMVWEFLQRGSRALRFDPMDLAATLVGALLALGVWHRLGRGSAGGP